MSTRADLYLTAPGLEPFFHPATDNDITRRLDTQWMEHSGPCPRPTTVLPTECLGSKQTKTGLKTVWWIPPKRVW